MVKRDLLILAIVSLLAYFAGRCSAPSPPGRAPDLSHLQHQIELLERERSMLRAELSRQQRVERRLMRRDTLLVRELERVRPSVSEECAPEIESISRLFAQRLAVRDTVIAEQRELITSLATRLEQYRDSTVSALKESERAIAYWRQRAQPDILRRIWRAVPYIAVGVIIGILGQ